jgi:hypothetical protein
MTLRSSSRLIIGLGLLAFIIFSSSCDGNDNFVVNPATLCSCDASIEGPCAVLAGRWRFTNEKLLGVIAHDFTNGDFIGTECEGEPGPITNVWRPVDGFQHQMVGTLEHFNWSIPGDKDWNIHVIPNSAFIPLIDDVEALHPGSKSWHKKCGEPRCMETEISPDKQFWNNPWFFQPGVRPEDTDNNGFSILEGRQIGFYGPWVMDMNHSFGSEIHPVHMMWFKDHFEGGFGGSGPFDIFWLMFLQDNTGRFDDRDDFDCGGSAPSFWKPWTDAPRSGQMSIAFEVNPGTEVVTFHIEELFKRFVVTSQDAQARVDADNGTVHGLEINGKVVVRVEEGQPNDDDLGVTFTNLCIGGDGKLRGFVSIRSVIGGNDDRDEEGFHILYATRTLRKERPDVVRPDIGELPVLMLTANELGGSVSTDRGRFIGNYQVTLHGTKYTTDRDFAISKVEFAGGEPGRPLRQELKFEQAANAKEILVKGVPLTEGQIIVTSASGRKLVLPSRSIGLAPDVKETIVRTAPDADAAKYLAASVGGVAGRGVSSEQRLARFAEVSVKLEPQYAAYNGEESISDSDSAFVDELNQRLAKGGLSSPANPITVAWTFEATNLATGQPVPVYTDNRTAADGVQVQLPAASSITEPLKIKFPPAAAAGITELRATATITDQQGQQSTFTHRVWSHGFASTINTLEDYASLVQSLTGLRDASVLLIPRPRITPGDIMLPPDDKTRRAYILNTYLRKSLRDKQITIEELRTLVHALKMYAVG